MVKVPVSCESGPGSIPRTDQIFFKFFMFEQHSRLTFIKNGSDFVSNALSEIVTCVPAGRLNNQKMMTLTDMVHSQLFTIPECRAILLPVVVKRVKELLTGPQEVPPLLTTNY